MTVFPGNRASFHFAAPGDMENYTPVGNNATVYLFKATYLQVFLEGILQVRVVNSCVELFTDILGVHFVNSTECVSTFTIFQICYSDINRIVLECTTVYCTPGTHEKSLLSKS